jgi:peptidoglycan hydrolase CwlO-like protein
MNAEINNLERNIQLKEGTIKSLYENCEEYNAIKLQYHSKLKTLEHEVNKLKVERDKILKQMETQSELTEEQKVSKHNINTLIMYNRSKYEGSTKIK